ncbi:MAG TPA: hypothetical protein VOA80_19570 [Thermoanaerobaculia bacterium]|nr:hypothetical protein [Thermoanaerobaculia bacterium]
MMPEAVRRFGFLPGPLVSIALFVLARGVPFDIVILVFVYGVFLSLFWAAPWRHRRWPSSSDERTEAFRRLILRIRHALVVAMIIVPVLIISHFILVVNLPSLIDDLLVTSSIVADAGAHTNDFIPVVLSGSSATRSTNTSYIIVADQPAKQAKLYIASARLLLKPRSAGMVHSLCPAAWVILLLAVVFVIGLRMAELLGEGALDGLRGMNE